MKRIIILLAFLCFGFNVHTQDTGLTPEIQEHIKARVETQTNVGIVIGYIDGHRIEYISAGNTALENGAPVDKNSVFEIGSISKVFTAILLAQKIKNGDMSLSDSISKYLPETVKVPSRNGKVITIKDLATHTSALPRMPDNFTPSNPNNPFADYTYAQLYSFLSQYELTRDIGVQYEYSNLGMGLLGHILELQSGKTYEQLVIENIAEPLKMYDTRLVLNDAMRERIAKGHSGLNEVENWDIITLGGAGGIRSTVSDMVKFVQANMGVLKTPIYEAMQLSHKPSFESEDSSFKIGLAWHYEDEGKIIWHNGRTGGYSSFIGFIPETKKGVVVLTNGTEDIGALSFRILGGPKPLVKPKKSIISLLQKEINTNGIVAGIALYKKAKAETPEDYRFEEETLNTLGYLYLNEDKKDIALEVFKLNIEEYPKASNPYDSLGEAYLEHADTTSAVKNYKKALELNPANDNARDVLKRLGEHIKDIVVPEDLLKSYEGKYELAPTFHIVITTKDGRLYAQATAQPQFEIFASDYNTFYFKVVEAKIEFNANNKGKIESLTLFQNGQEMPGKKIE